MRECPVCTHTHRTKVFSMTYNPPDGWPLPKEIIWYTCDRCKMIYGDGDFSQKTLDNFYRNYYGFGVNNPANTERLKKDAEMIDRLVSGNHGNVVDFGGGGDDGKSALLETLKSFGYDDLYCVHASDFIPECDVLYASHVLEHIYDLPQTMRKITKALSPHGLLIVDVPDSTGLLQHWQMPILDFNTKHINHFTIRNLLDLGFYHGFEMMALKTYVLEGAPCVQAHFRRWDLADESMFYIQTRIAEKLTKLLGIREPVNIWGLSDITWHILSKIDIEVLDYIDSDPAMRGATFKGKPILERPTNDAPIVIMAQGQRRRLIEYIKQANIHNEIIEI